MNVICGMPRRRDRSISHDENADCIGDALNLHYHEDTPTGGVRGGVLAGDPRGAKAPYPKSLHKIRSRVYESEKIVSILLRQYRRVESNLKH